MKKKNAMLDACVLASRFRNPFISFEMILNMVHMYSTLSSTEIISDTAVKSYLMFQLSGIWI